MKYEQLVTGVIDHTGGARNLAHADHCATRMRLALKDPSKLDLEELRAVPGVLGARSLNENEVQVIVGTDVLNIYSEFVTKAKYSGPSGDSTGGTPRVRPATIGGWAKHIGNSILTYLSGTVRPVIPIFLTSGLLLAFLTILTTFVGVSSESGTFKILNASAMAGFTFVPIALGWSAANTLKVEPALGALLGAVLVYPEISDVEGLDFLGIPVHPMTYTGSFLPIVLSVPVLAVVYKFLRDKIPQAIRYFLLPLLTMLIVIPVTLVALGPISDWIGAGFAVSLNWLGDNFRLGASAIWSAFAPIGVITGIDKAVLFGFQMPIMLEVGYDDLFFPGALAGNAAIGGAALAVFIMSRSVNTKSLSSSTGITAILGITEPALYGVLIPYRTPMIGAMAGAAVGGVFGAIFDLKQYQPVGPGLMTAAVYISPDGSMGNFWVAIATIAISAAAGLIFTILLSAKTRGRYTDDAIATPGTASAANNASAPATADTTPVNTDTASIGVRTKTKTALILAPVEGTFVPLSEVSDPAFAGGSLGKGGAIKPTSAEVRSPVSGSVMVVMPHAYGLKTDDGVEVLIHIGIDTNRLDGDGFTTEVKMGDKVEIGTALGTFDIDKITQSGFDPVVIVVVTNSKAYESVDVAGASNLTAGDPLLAVTA